MVFDIELENSIIGNLITDPQNYYLINEIISKDSFYDLENQKIFQIIEKALIKDENPDIIYIQKKAKIKSIKLIERTEKATPYIVRASQTLQEIHIKRKIETEIIKYQQKIEEADAYELIAEINEISNEVSNLIRLSKLKTSYELAKEYREYIERLQNGKEKIIPTPNTKINTMLKGGFEKGKLYGVAARTGTGKTAYLIACISEILNERTLFYSLEQTQNQIITRILANRLNINSYKITNEITPEDRERVLMYLVELAEKKLFIDERSWQIENLVIDMKKNIRRNKIEIVFIDYLQKIQTKRRFQSRDQELTYITETLVDVSKSMNIPIVVAIQLNRGAEDKKPSLSNLRESGGIEQALNVCIGLHETNIIDPYDYIYEYELIIMKNRDGMTGEEVVEYNKPFFQFNSKVDKWDF